MAATVDVGGGRTAHLVTKRAPGATIPAGVVVAHRGGSCWVSAMWSGPGDVFTLDSLRPLTVLETIACPRCGERGRIVADEWVPQ